MQPAEDAATPQLGYVDTHAHFLDSARDEADQVVARAIGAGVVRLLSPAIDLENCQTVLNVALLHPEVCIAIGIHPNSALSRDDFGALAALARGDKVKAIGETGLDYHRTYTSRELQKAHLERHLRLAAELKLPIILHNREADEDLLHIVHAYSSSVRGVLHCFSSTMETADRFLELGFYISFAGNTTYPSAAALRDVAANIPLDRLLVETDSPYLTPVPLRGKPNEPAYVAFTYRKLAELRHMPVSALLPAVARNAQQLFNW
jgi:TatD DNase family protein